jgi:hypothetical protein
MLFCKWKGSLMKFMMRILKSWLVLAVAITGLSGSIYLAVQQVQRLAANDPQIQLAEDGAAALSAGQSVAAVVPEGTVDMANSLAPFVMVFNQNGTPLAGDVQLQGRLPDLPAGVFEAVRQHGEDRITWQPQPGVRNAAVMVAFSGKQPGYMLAGRSLREVEKRADQLLLLVGAAWLVAIAATFILTLLFEVFQTRTLS